MRPQRRAPHRATDTRPPCRTQMSRNGLSNASRHGLMPNIEHPSLHAPIQRTEQAAIVGEIAARLIQWRSLHLSESPPTKWLLRISLLAQDSPDALWLYLSIQSGDLSALTNTYQEQATALHLSRQDIHQRHTRALEAMTAHFPELKHTITELHHLFRPKRGLNGHKNFAGPSQVVPA